MCVPAHFTLAAQIFNPLYRRFAIGRLSQIPTARAAAAGQQE
jgi:hypothetical protein